MTIILAIRIGEGSRAAADAATKLAGQLGAELRIVYVAKELEAVAELASAAGQSEEEVRVRMMSEIRDRLRSEVGEELASDARLVIVEGDVPKAVSRAAVDLEAELIIVGMRGRSALARLVLGDTTGAILERAPCPVVVIPPAMTEGLSNHDRP
jgi:nucleotide-binding universal stress UspA family protein